MRTKLLALAAAVLFAAPAANAAVATPYLEGPDRPPVTAPDQVVTVLNQARFDSCAGMGNHTQAVNVPSGTWDRVILELTAESDGDPWDRLFSVSIDGVEVLRGTTPRVTFTVRRDITEYASLLPPGGTANLRLNLDTYVGAWLGTVKLEFYGDEPTGALVARPWDRIDGAFLLAGLHGTGSTIQTTVNFPALPPVAATVDLTVTNHGADEAMFANRSFRLYVDGREIATMQPVPYTYAIVGFGAANANSACSGPATTPSGQQVNGALWWTAQQAGDPLGVHHGPGEIPPYRAQVAAADLALLTGASTVEVRQDSGQSVWVTSLAFLLDL